MPEFLNASIACVIMILAMALAGEFIVAKREKEVDERRLDDEWDALED